MESFKIEVEETKTYWQRMRRVLFLRFLLLNSYILFLYFFTGKARNNNDFFVLFFILYAPFLIILLFFCDSACSSYIHFIEITEKRVHIIGTKRNKPFEIDDSIENFVFRLRLGNRIIQSNSINIIYKGNNIKQYDKWNWKQEKVFDNLWDYLEKRNLVYKNWFKS